MKIEFLFPEFCNLFGDSSNIRYLKRCLPDAEIIETHYNDEPAFMREKVNLIYMGAMTENAQLKVIQKLLPYKEKIIELINQDTPFLITSNALEVFGQWIELEDGTKEEALGIFHFYAKQNMMHRFNCLSLGHFEDLSLVGFKTQFSMAYYTEPEHPFFIAEKGIGMNPSTDQEGIHYHRFYGTYLVGPFLVLNPLFTKRLIKEMGGQETTLAYESVVMEAYQRRLAEFNDPKTDFFN